METHHRILIVDDDDTIRKTLKAILEDEGYTVDSAATGQEAIRKTEENTYNVALLDIRLPDMEGVELLKLIKDNVPKTRKIMLTGYPSMQNAIAALNKDADAYLVKPVDVEKLLYTIKNQLELQENERNFSEEKIADFIESRVKEISTTKGKH
jgi:DNA-binding NtrC family response regulator